MVGNACGGKLGSHGSKDTAESHTAGGAVTISSLPTASISSRTIDRLAHPAPDTELQSRTSARGPTYAPDTPNNREGPQASKPAKCLNRRSYGERLAKKAF